MLFFVFISCHNEYVYFDSYVSPKEESNIKEAVSNYLGVEYVDVYINSALKIEHKRSYKYTCDIEVKSTKYKKFYTFVLNASYVVVESKFKYAINIGSESSDSDNSENDGSIASCYCGAKNKTGGYCKRKVKPCGTRCWQHK